MFVACAFYTPEYAKEVQHLVRSCKLLGVDLYLKSYGSTGSWVENTQIKPSFILHCLEKFTEKDILYVDAHAEIKREPELFKDGIEGDVAVYRFPHNRPIGDQILSGTMYFTNNNLSRKFVTGWVRRTEMIIEKGGDQEHLPYIFQEMAEVKRVQLPPEYVKIFDRKDMGNKPAVIQHNQASRRLKKIVEGLRE